MKKINKNQRWAKKQIGQWMNSWEFVDSNFDGKSTVVTYKHKISVLTATGVAHYYEGDQRSDVVAGHLADSRAQLFMIETLLTMIEGYRMFYKLFWSEKNEKLKWLELEARRFRNIVIKDIHKCQKSLEFKQKD